ncbi:hypothetical protein [Salinarimonas soli]|uniref:Uncharacterized protein n=1 Tax=Salinarimonas soli TaxID=1638099 RepID=A0A5B2V8Q6_9HYPH|nr:hypothetical protein [Salinarimonas soli]KAA2234955.1 hypothetical protein F0L46_21675 [Salinarimonas soli]
MTAPLADALPPDERLHAVLRDLRARFGEDLLGDRRRLVSLLGDHVPEARREIRLIGLSLDDGLPAVLRRLPPEQLPLQVHTLATRLETQYGIGGAYARWVVAFWLKAFALDPPAGFEAGPCAPGESPPAPPERTAPMAPPPPAGPSGSGVQPRTSPVTGLFRDKRALALGGVLAVVGLGLGLGALSSGATPPPEPQAVAAAPPAPTAPIVRAEIAAPAPAPAVSRAEPAPPVEEVYTALGAAQGARTPEAAVTHVPGRVLVTRFTVPGSPIRYTVTLRPEAAAADWTAIDPQGRRSAASGSLERGAADAAGGVWDWSRVAWRGENGLGLGPLCLAVQAGRAGAPSNPDGGLVCLYDHTCAAAYGCLRMRTR